MSTARLPYLKRPHSPGSFNRHPLFKPGAGSERSEGSNVLAFLGVLLSKHFRFLAALGMTRGGGLYLSGVRIERACLIAGVN